VTAVGAPAVSRISAALWRSHKFVSKLEVWTDGIGSGAPGATLIQGLDQFTGASVTDDETRQVRRTLTATINSPSVDDPTTTVPVAPGDLLHPVSGHEVRAFTGLEYADGSIDWCPNGVFRISKPQVTDLGGQVTIALTGNDRSVVVSQAGWLDAWAPTPGTTIDQVIKQGINRVFPNNNWVMNLTPTSIPISGGVVFGGQIDSSNDPWKDMQDLATAIGYELFFDATGAVTMRVVPQAVASASDWPNVHTNPEFLYEQGQECIIPSGAGGTQGLSHTIDETNAFSRVIVIGNPPSGTVVQGHADDLNPTSSTYSLGPFGIVAKVISSAAITTVAQANAAAQSYLNKFGLALDEISFPAITNPAIQAGDILMAWDERIGIANIYAASAVTTPFDPQTLQTVVCRPSRGGQGFLHPN
jgi:kumamolisin